MDAVLKTIAIIAALIVATNIAVFLPLYLRFRREEREA